MPVMHEGEYRQHELKFRFIPGSFAICQLPADAAVPEWAATGPFFSATRSGEELSIVCQDEKIPDGVKADRRWICLKLEGPFAFSQSGILSSFIQPLADQRIPIFAISTYDTDYVLVKKEFAGLTLDTLRDAGHELLSEQ
jgi:hypothetical protein